MQLGMVSCVTLTSILGFAEDVCTEVYQESGFFVGLGGSYHSVQLKQDYSAQGTGNVFDDTGTLFATGEAGGPGAPFTEIVTTFAPEAQVGYCGYFGCCCSFWGVKFLYQYLDTTSIDTLLDTPQAGILDPVGASPLAFTGNVITKSSQVKVDHKMALFAFLGMQLDCFKVYLGAGPSIFYAKSNIYQAFGFANLDGIPRDATGTPVSFSSSDWVWGGAAQVGFSYILQPCWFLDFNYTYSISANFCNDYSAPFETTSVLGFTDIGTLFVETKGQIRDQSWSITINRSF